MEWERINHNNNFDLIRLLAACQVVANHAIVWLHLPIPNASRFLLGLFPGVPIFFVISGFLIASSLMQRRGLKTYFWNRFLRIYPGLWLNLILIVALLYSAGVILYPSDPNLYYFLGTLAASGSTILSSIFTDDYIFQWNANTLPFFPGGALWTIPIELSFYIVLPLLLMSKARLIIAFGTIVVSLAFAALFGGDPGPWWTVTCLPYLWMFLLGTTAYLCWHNIKRAFEGTFLLWLTAYISFSSSLSVVLDYQNPTMKIFFSLILLAGTTLSFAHTMPALSSILKRQDLSYGIYLNHMPIVMVFMKLNLTNNPWLWIALLATTFMVAAASWFLIERPALKLKSWAAKRDLSFSQSLATNRP
jgi:peptidoglycan/LPS O-acetylase OafA/YrhL